MFKRFSDGWWSLAVMTCLVLALPAFAGAPIDESEFARVLGSGEFSTARSWIARAPASQRDVLRLQLAEAQFRAGAMRGAARTYGEVSPSSSLASSWPSRFRTPGPFGGGIIADFDTLMDLIRETIDPDSWEETGDGNGTMRPFPLGVLVDARGRLALRRPMPGSLMELQRARESARAEQGNRDVRLNSSLRKVSLNRLERQLVLRVAMGLPPTDEMLHLAGIHRITHLFLFPESGEIVIAGPADGWRVDAAGRHVSHSTGEPTLWLDDWIEIWRNTKSSSSGFYCSIEPRPDNLKRTAAFLANAREHGITGGREQWLESLQAVLGEQDLVVEGIDPRSRAAHVILEADYHMKRIGVGLEETVFGVPSYFDLLASARSRQSSQVLRWWFTLSDEPLQVAADGTAFALPERPVRLQSENPRINAQGRPTSSGKRDPLNHRFATSFTREYRRLERRYPVYADLRNIMHWAVVAAVIEGEQEAGRIEWEGRFFSDSERCPVRYASRPQSVQSVVNQRTIAGGRTVTAVSGGVRIDASRWRAREETAVPDRYGKLPSVRVGQRREADLPPEHWWWD